MPDFYFGIDCDGDTDLELSFSKLRFSMFSRAPVYITDKLTGSTTCEEGGFGFNLRIGKSRLMIKLGELF